MIGKFCRRVCHGMSCFIDVQSFDYCYGKYLHINVQRLFVGKKCTGVRNRCNPSAAFN